MSSPDSSDKEEFREEVIRSILKEGIGGLDGDFEGLDFGVGHSLNDKTPEDALEAYLEDVARDSAQGTYDSHKSRLNFFVDWCSQDDEDGSRRITYLHELSGEDIMDFRNWRREESGWKPTTEETQMKTLRKFLRYCEKPEWAPENISKKVPIPNIDPEDESRDTIIRQNQVDTILDYLEKFEYATLQHCVWLVLGRTGCRISDFRALDLCDYEPNEETGKAVLKFRHRKETGTPLKNKFRSERDFEVEVEVNEPIADYIEHQRPDVTDDNGREPLFATPQGRPAESTIRKYVYMWSRPCEYKNECPYNRDISECEATQTNDAASKCPESVSPHPIRRGRLTWHLNEGAMPQMLSETYDVSPQVLKKHYDERSHAEKQRLASMWQDMIQDAIMDDIRD